MTLKLDIRQLSHRVQTDISTVFTTGITFTLDESAMHDVQCQHETSKLEEVWPLCSEQERRAGVMQRNSFSKLWESQTVTKTVSNQPVKVPLKTEVNLPKL